MFPSNMTEISVPARPGSLDALVKAVIKILEIQNVPLKTGQFVRRNKVSGTVFDGTFCINT
jgi:hypothetical protein